MSGPNQGGGAKHKTPSPLHALQLRAFLSAAEDAEADSDTIEDLLDGLDEDVCTEMTDFDSDSEASDTEDLSLIVQAQSTSSAVVGTASPVDDDDLDTAEIRELEDECR
jgi:hypothetical protein